MEPNEVEFEKFVANLRIDDKPDPGHKDRLRWQVLQAYHTAADQPACRSRLSRIRRLIMKSSIAKFALAASVIFAVLLGLFYGLGSGDLLASAAQKLEQIDSMSYTMHMTMTGLPGMPADFKMNMDMDILMANGLGMRMTGAANGSVASTSIMNFADKVMINLMPQTKQYMRITLTDELLDKTKQQNADPRMMVEGFLNTEYTDLGRSQIDGVEVQGFESNNPAMTGGMFKDTIVRIWVDVSTGYPLRMTIDGQMGLQEGARIEAIVDNFQWNVPCDAEMFALVIPEGYSLMGDLSLKGLGNGDELIEALKYFQDLSGGRFPKSLNALDLSKELIDLAKDGSKPELAGKMGQDKVLKFTIAATNFQMLTVQNADPKYYGDTVQPGDAAKVLARWKTPEGNYRVIYGDLHTDEVTAEKLAELEAQP
ncbi:MAG: hypothetical protein GX455_11880 [Phycisphaerae bacterium]|nr:hypothetical protein [Phycisphaerae bacterium]